MQVDIIVCTRSTIPSELNMVCSHGSISVAAPMPYITSTMLFPTRSVEMKISELE